MIRIAASSLKNGTFTYDDTMTGAGRFVSTTVVLAMLALGAGRMTAAPIVGENLPPSPTQAIVMFSSMLQRSFISH